MRFRTFLFDLDGTLIDHFDAIHRSYSHTMEQLGLTKPTLAQVRAAVGGGLENAFRRILPPEHQVEGLKIYREYWDRTMLDDVKLLPGALELLRGLHEESAAIAICTNKIGSSSRLICDKLGMTPFLKAVVGAGDTPWLKPDPEFTGHMVQLVGGTRDNCLLVGDSPYDIQAAHNGGLNAWCVTTGTHEAPQLRVAGADEVFDALPEIGRALGLESIRG